jgi:RNA polymerase sigma-70 factor (ECF subfamily)
VRDESLPTRPSLLARVCDPRDQTAWSQFAALYAPVIHGYLRGRGLQDADAADVTQEALQKVMRSVARLEYDRGKGKFRSWLLTITRNAMIDHVNRRRKDVAGSGDTAVQALLDARPAPAGAVGADEAGWDRACQQRVLQWAMEQVCDSFEEKTWRAFRETALQHRSAEDVAAELSMSVNAVYVAKSRVTARLRRLVAELEDDG